MLKGILSGTFGIHARLLFRSVLPAAAHSQPPPEPEKRNFPFHTVRSLLRRLKRKNFLMRDFRSGGNIFKTYYAH